MTRHWFGLALIVCLHTPASAEGLAINPAIGTLVTISDGDFDASSYYSGLLAPREAGHEDLLSVIRFSDDGYSISRLPVSNSVTASPEVLALSRDGSTAFVVERLGQRGPGMTRVAELPPGRMLTAIDLSDPSQPRQADSIALEASPEALALHPAGDRIAVVSNTPTASTIQVVSYADGHFTEPARFDVAELGIHGDADQPRGGVTLSNIHWHPSGRALAVNVNTQDRVAFFTVTEGEHGIELHTWGEPVAVGRDPFVGRFSPDGRFYLTSDWGRDLTATSLEGRIPDQASSISVIRLAEAGDRHQRIASVATAPNAEGLAISPDGRLVATVNMQGTVFAPDSPRFQRDASVTLLRFDPTSGELEKLADYPFEGVLPEGGSFSPDGRHFFATVFQGHADEPPNAGLEVFRIDDDQRPALQRIGRIPLPHGVHHVEAGAR
ncbi:lactonase family protein [Halotalea alkalilenta]|nr:lactonase family protein [Halotalea alkalilenta]